MQALVSALDTDKSGDISRDEFDQGFTKIVAGLVRRGSIAFQNANASEQPAPPISSPDYSQ